MSGINLLPKRALAYPGTRLTFVDDSSVAYCFGSAVRITHLLPDKVRYRPDEYYINTQEKILLLYYEYITLLRLSFGF